MRSSFKLFIAASGCLADHLTSNSHLADAVHAIANKCHTHEEHNACSNYATTELASCSPDDLNCQRANVGNILSFCEDICGDSDYTPFAVRQFLNNDNLQALVRKDISMTEQSSFVVGKKEFTASEVIDALALKQFTETRDQPFASWQMLEERLKPAVSNIRDSLERQLPQESSLVNKEHKDPSFKLALPQHKRVSDDKSGISSPLKACFKDPQTGDYLPLAISDSPNGLANQTKGSTKPEGLVEILGLDKDDEIPQSSDEEIAKILGHESWNYIEPTTKDDQSLTSVRLRDSMLKTSKLLEVQPSHVTSVAHVGWPKATTRGTDGDQSSLISDHSVFKEESETINYIPLRQKDIAKNETAIPTRSQTVATTNSRIGVMAGTHSASILSNTSNLVTSPSVVSGAQRMQSSVWYPLAPSCFILFLTVLAYKV